MERLMPWTRHDEPPDSGNEGDLPARLASVGTFPACGLARA